MIWKVDKQINVFQPDLGKDELEAVARVFARNWPGKGLETTAFETEFSEYLSVPPKNILSTNSCTEAAFQILEMIGHKDHEVIIPTNSFVGIANSVIAAGMKLIFCDVDPVTGNPTLEDIKAVRTSATKIIIIQHFGGIPADIEQISHWASEEGIVLIEDAAGATGSKVKGVACGTFGDYGIWSLDSMKMVVAGDGGVVYARDSAMVDQLRERMYMGLRNFSGSASLSVGLKENRWWEFDVSYSGRRSIMNDISASIARVQLSKLDRNIKLRKANAERYLEAFSGVASLILPVKNFLDESCHYFFPIQLELRDSLAEHLKHLGVYTTFRYFPLNRVPLYRATEGNYPASDLFSDRTLLLPQHSRLSDSDLFRIIDGVKSFALGHESD
jgi:aminotransferase